MNTEQAKTIFTTMRTCKECAENLRGRADQKFCSDYCRSAYHNRHRRTQYRDINRINTILQKNRRILLQIVQEELTQLQQSVLLARGYNPSFYTSRKEGKEGPVYYCYDICYQQIGEQVRVFPPE